jgi:hypothetical protein
VFQGPYVLLVWSGQRQRPGFGVLCVLVGLLVGTCFFKGLLGWSELWSRGSLSAPKLRQQRAGVFQWEGVGCGQVGGGGM